MSWNDFRFAVFLLLVAAGISGSACGITTCTERCSVWNNQVDECVHSDDPSACRTELLANPPPRCSLSSHTVSVPRWQVQQAAGGAP